MHKERLSLPVAGELQKPQRTVDVRVYGVVERRVEDDRGGGVNHHFYLPRKLREVFFSEPELRRVYVASEYADLPGHILLELVAFHLPQLLESGGLQDVLRETVFCGFISRWADHEVEPPEFRQATQDLLYQRHP